MELEMLKQNGGQTDMNDRENQFPPHQLMFRESVMSRSETSLSSQSSNSEELRKDKKRRVPVVKKKK